MNAWIATRLSAARNDAGKWFLIECKEWIAAPSSTARNDAVIKIVLYYNAALIRDRLTPAAVAPHPLIGMRADHFFKTGLDIGG